MLGKKAITLILYDSLVTHPQLNPDTVTQMKSGAEINAVRLLKHTCYCSGNDLHHFKVEHAVAYYRHITKPHVHMCCIVLTLHVVHIICSHDCGEQHSNVAAEVWPLWGGMVSVKADIEFVILAPGAREDLFSDVTMGVLVWMFICLSHWQRLLSIIRNHQQPSATNDNPIKHHLQMLGSATGWCTCKLWCNKPTKQTTMFGDH